MTTPSHLRERSARIEGKILLKWSPGQTEFVLFSGNLCRSGLFIENFQATTRMGDKLSLEITAPSSEVIFKTRGQVVRLRPANQLVERAGVAISFVDTDTRQKQKLIRLIQDLFETRGLGCRQDPRILHHLEVDVSNKAQRKKVMMRDISRGGLFVLTPTSGLALGDIMQIHLQSQGHKAASLALTTEIVHLRQGELPGHRGALEGVGLRFVDMSEQQESQLLTFLKSELS